MSARLSVLTYHSIDESGSVLSTHPDTLARQMAQLEAIGFRGVPLAVALASARERGSWPERTVAITFDDGYANNCEVAQPILARHGFAATIYLITAHVGGDNAWEAPPPRLGRVPTLGWDQAGELAEAGWEVGAHTRTHPNLQQVAADRAAEEILGSCDDIARNTGARVQTFAYPGGHVSSDAAAIVQRELTGGCTTVLQRAGYESLHLLPRVDMFYLRDASALADVVTGRRDGRLAARRMARRLRRMFRRPGP